MQQSKPAGIRQGMGSQRKPLIKRPRKLRLRSYFAMPSTAKVRYLAYFSPIFRTAS
jgi:hypothetical protein